MPDLICDTSPIQYLHQLGLLQIVRTLGEQVLVPPAVVDELAVGRSLGVNLPDVEGLGWVTVRRPISEAASPLVTHPNALTISITGVLLDPGGQGHGTSVKLCSRREREWMN